MTKNIKEDRYVNRRKMAWWSFWLLLLLGAALLLFGLSDDARAERVNSLGFLITTMLGVWVSVILAYFGASTVTDRAEIKYGAVEGPLEGGGHRPAPTPAQQATNAPQAAPQGAAGGQQAMPLPPARPQGS